MNTLPTPATPATTKKLNRPTSLLFHIAARSHSLADQFGVELISPDDKENEPLTFLQVSRPWLVEENGELTFDADRYAKTVDACSTYTRHMRLFILNVWNPGYAKSKGWTFDLFAALRGLDDNNSRAIAWFCKTSVWP